MSIGKFDYFAPDTLDDAIGLLKQYGSRARIMAGGTDLMVKMRLGAVSPEVVVSLKNISGLDTVTVDPEKGLTIGAMTLLADVAAHPEIQAHYSAIAAAAGETANVQVRNMGTVVGNLCNASPSAVFSQPPPKDARSERLSKMACIGFRFCLGWRPEDPQLVD